MLSFNISLPEIKELMRKFFRESKLFPTWLAKQIMDKLAEEEKKEKIKEEHEISVKDELFDEIGQ